MKHNRVTVKSFDVRSSYLHIRYIANTGQVHVWRSQGQDHQSRER